MPTSEQLHRSSADGPGPCIQGSPRRETSRHRLTTHDPGSTTNNQRHPESEDPNILYYVNNKYQTLTYFGLSKNVLRNFILDNRLEGIDRIVPIGQALDINFFWDGYDLNKILTRIIDIR